MAGRRDVGLSVRPHQKSVLPDGAHHKRSPIRATDPTTDSDRARDGARRPDDPMTESPTHYNIRRRRVRNGCAHTYAQLVSFFFAMYIVYPRAGGFDDIPFVAEFNYWYDAM